MLSSTCSTRTSTVESSKESRGNVSRQACSAAPAIPACAAASSPALSAKNATVAPTPPTRRASFASFSATRAGSLPTGFNHAEVAGLAAVRAVILPVHAQPDSVLAAAEAAVAVAAAIPFRLFTEHADDRAAHSRLWPDYKRAPWRRQDVTRCAASRATRSPFLTL